MSKIDRRAFISLGMGAVAWACARPGRQTADPTASPANELKMTQATTEIAVGDRRLSFAFLLGNKPTSPDNEGDLNALLVSPGGGSPVRVNARPESIRFEGATEQHEHSGAEVETIYVVDHEFDEPGNWRVNIPLDNERGIGMPFQVVEESLTVPRGGKAIASKSPTVSDARGVDPICTRTPACSMHDVSIADALAARKPLVVAFATPKFCESRTCGPTVEIIESAKRKANGEASFVHVEVWKDDESVGEEPAPTFAEWRLPGEPFVFFIGADGIVKDRWSGALGEEETVRAIDRLVAGRL